MENIVNIINSIVWSAGLAWAMGDIGVGLMAWLNLGAIVLLSNTVIKCFKDYEKQMKLDIPRHDITFNPAPLGIKGAKFCEEKVASGDNTPQS
ncbi:alanine:cation symporter family protein [Terrisporobacter glycolicus]|nr:alanine:cation symporter family protein [Terrisporobacter glycolicus]